MEENNKQKSVAEVISLRGTCKIYLPDNAFEFVPQKKGEPMQKDVKNQLKKFHKIGVSEHASGADFAKRRDFGKF